MQPSYLAKPALRETSAPMREMPAALARRLAADRPRPDPRAAFAPELSYGRHRMPPLPDTRAAAVLVLIYPGAQGWTLPLTRRPGTLSVHAGQVSLPGGCVHDGETVEQAALREFEEELGASACGFTVLGRLSPVFIYGSNFYVTPCVATAAERPGFRPNRAEVERIIELPLAELVNPRHRGSHWIRRREVRFRAPHIAWQGERIWGATRLILAELSAIVEELSASTGPPPVA